MPRITTEWTIRILCTDRDGDAGTHEPVGFATVEWTHDFVHEPPERRIKVHVENPARFWLPDAGDILEDLDDLLSPDERKTKGSRSSYRLRCPRCRRDVRIKAARWDELMERSRQHAVASIELKHLEAYR